MKHIPAFFLVLAVVVIFASCGVRESPQTVQASQTEVETAAVTAETTAEGTTAVSVKTGWNFDGETGTLSLYEQRFLEKPPYSGDPREVLTLELDGSVTDVSPMEYSDSPAYYPNLKTLILGDSVRKLGGAALEGCAHLERIVIGSGLREIEENAFFGTYLDVSEGCAGCVDLRTLEVSDRNPFFTARDNVLYNKDCTELVQYPLGIQKTEFVIPDSVRTVRWFAFTANQTIEKLTVGKGIKAIEFGLINCRALKELVLPETLESIGDSTIKFCGLRSVRIPDSVTYLGMEAFRNCDDLEELHIGKGLDMTDSDFMCNSPKLAKVTVDEGNKTLCMVDGVVFSKDRKTLLLYPGGYTQKEYRIPDGTEIIEYYAFHAAGHLKKVFVPASVTQIEPYNFSVSPDVEAGYDTYTYPYEVWYGGTAEQWNAVAQTMEGADGLTVHCSANAIR